MPPFGQMSANPLKDNISYLAFHFRKVTRLEVVENDELVVVMSGTIILLIKTTAAQNEVALSYHRVRGLYFLAVVFVVPICTYLC